MWPLLIAIIATPAAEPHRFDGFRVDGWSDEQGLPQNTVTDLVQDRDGFLWAATFGGVVRFDGIEFDVFDLTNGLRSPRALSLGLGPDGDVWVGLEDRGVQRIRDGAVRPLPDHLRLDEGEVGAIVWSADRLWIICDDEVRVATDAGWKPIGAGGEGIAADGRGGVWFSRASRVWHSTGTSSTAVFATPAGGPIISLAKVGDEPWFVTPLGVFRVRDGKADHVVESGQASGFFGHGPTIDPDGDLWFAVQDVVYRVPQIAVALAQRSDDAPIVPRQRATWPLNVRQIFVDRERNIWLGVTAGGLWRLSPEPFFVIRSEEPDRAGITGIVPVRDGLVFGTPCSGLTHMASDGTRRLLQSFGCVGALWSDIESGTVWACTNALEAHRLDGGRTVYELPGATSTCSALLRDRAGRLWVGARGWLFELAEERLVPVDVDVEGSISVIAERPDGSLWLGQHGRVVVMNGTDRRILDEDDGIPKGQIRTIHFRDDATYVGSYGGGLARLTSDGAARYSRSNGLLDNFVSYVTTDDEGRVWVSSNRGVARIPIEDFEAVAKGQRPWLRAHAIRLGETEGRTRPSAHFDGEKLWIAGVNGLGRIDVDAVVPNSVPPVAQIKSASIDGVSLDPSSDTTVGPGRGELRVRFHAAMLRAPGLRAFEHRLHGLDAGWVRTEAGPGQAIYDGLAPGQYRFEVRAINEDGVVGPPAGFAFSLEPHITERPAFRGALGLVFVALAWVFARWRTRDAERRAEVLAKEVDSRRFAEAALRDSETHYRNVFTTSVNAFFVLDVSGRIVDVNPSACEMFGYAADELQGEGIERIVPGAGTEDFEVQLCTRKDGSSFEARVRGTPYTFDGGHRTVLTVVDLSPLVESQRKERRLREQLLHSQRVEAMGRLAGGIAHDVNNMLTAVKCYADLALSAIERDPARARTDLLEITAGVERTTKLTKQLLAFGQRQTAQPRPIDLAKVVQDVMPMLSRLSRDDIEIVFAHDGDRSTVFADPTHLEQIVVNLVINASQAMPEGGKITLGIDAPETDFVRLIVEDEGIGMTEEIKDRIFEPFFTTKESQESSGLGLSVVHGIVTQAGGRISVDSKPGEGSRFDIRLPAMEYAVGSGPMEVAAEDDEKSGGGERLLYCDDDLYARRATARILRNAGYEVLVAGHGDEAIELASGRDIALLVTDVVMPEMNGRELFEALRQRDPKLRVLYVSGYARDYLSDIGPSERFLPKPYDVKELLGEIRRLLDEA